MTFTSPTAALPPVLDLVDWDEFTTGHEEKYELVRGIPTVVPVEPVLNRAAVVTLCMLLAEAFEPEWKAIPGGEVFLGEREGRATVRVPDAVLVPRSVDPSAHREPASVVALVVEVVSPSSVETDWLVKREEYAAAGIPGYLVIDPHGEQPRMALFDRIVEGRYADPHPDGTRAVLTVGERSVGLRLADVLAW